VILSQPEPLLVKKGEKSSVTARTELPEKLPAPVEAGQTVGELILEREGERLAVLPLTAAESVARLTWADLFEQLMQRVSFGGTPQHPR
jgi:D-alanyl-D-alanine carboxypeptidase (penicillin-binding protein 5/6)